MGFLPGMHWPNASPVYLSALRRWREDKCNIYFVMSESACHMCYKCVCVGMSSLWDACLPIVHKLVGVYHADCLCSHQAMVKLLSITQRANDNNDMWDVHFKTVLLIVLDLMKDDDVSLT